jgi:O-antigen ligase
MTSIATMTFIRAKALDRKVAQRLADWGAVAVAVSLPWSTSATSILIVVWLVAVLPTLDLGALRRELASAAGGLPVLLWALAALGMLWADVSWHERLGGFGSFQRLLVIPVLLAQFRRSGNTMPVLFGFLASVVVLLLVSWLLVLFPALSWRNFEFGVPVKDYILQGEEFLICAVALLGIALDRARERRWRSAAALAIVAFAFLANIVFVATGRTALLVAFVLVLLLGYRYLRWKGLVAATLVFCVLGGAAWLESSYLRARLATSLSELRAWEATDALSSTALHLEFLKKSLSFVASAPLIGHGTGSIGEQFRNAAVGQSGAAAAGSVNPHNQIFAVAIQLGLLGAAVLLAMWCAHLALFTGGGLIAWFGLIIVTQNVVSCLFNSHLFDFTQGWLYVFGVGVTGGMALRRRDGGKK